MATLASAIETCKKLNQTYQGWWEQHEAARKVEERARALGPINPALVCPHCQTKGQVRTMRIERKQGISGGKATAAIFTLGWSLLATGLSRKVETTQAVCDTCHSTWTF